MTKAQVKLMLEKKVKLKIQIISVNDIKACCSKCHCHTYCYEVKLSIILSARKCDKHHGDTYFNKYVMLCEPCIINMPGKGDKL